MHLATLAFVLLPVTLVAQTNPGWCEANSQTENQLRQVASLDPQDGNRRVARLNLLHQLLTKYPDNLDINVRYQQLVRHGAVNGRSDVIARYKQLAATHPDSAPYQYLYASALLDTDTPQAIGIANNLLRTAPNFPRANLLLATIHSSGKFADKPQARSELRAFFRTCPAALNRQALGTLEQVADSSFAAQLAPPLRDRLLRETDPHLLENWEAVWNVEFKANSPADYGKVRQQIAADLVRLTRIHPDGDARWLAFLSHGYKLAGNLEASREEEAKLLAEHPQSEPAQRISDERWYQQHPWPAASDPAKLKAFQQANLQRAETKLKTSPHNVEYLWTRFSCLTNLDDTTNEQLIAAASAFLDQYRKTPDFFSAPPPQLQIAKAYLKRKIHIEEIPALVQESVSANLLFNGPPSDREADAIRKEQAQYNDFLTSENAAVLVDAARQLGNPSIAREAVAEVEALKPETPLAKTSRFQVEAKWAELQNRKLDALLFYRAALDSRPSDFKYFGKDELADNIARLRKELGGTAASQALWDSKPQQTQADEVTAWHRSTQDMKPWELTDLHGKTWKLTSFEGKVLLINVWATWCGPCQAEHPHLQKLYDQLKNDPKIQILTFNVDEEVGSVSPYMKEHSYTFPVLLAKDYVVDVIQSFSIPRNWIIDARGKWQWEQTGFGSPETWQSAIIKKLNQTE